MQPPHKAHRNLTSKRSSLVSSPMCPMLVLLAPFRFFQTSETKVLTNPRLSAIIIFAVMGWRCYAGVAQLVEQLICNQQVGGSNPSTSSTIQYGGVPEWPKGADCKSVAFRFGGSNPPSSTTWPQSLLCGHVFYPQDKKHAVRRLSVILFDPHLPSILLFFDPKSAYFQAF